MAESVLSDYSSGVFVSWLWNNDCKKGHDLIWSRFTSSFSSMVPLDLCFSEGGNSTTVRVWLVRSERTVWHWLVKLKEYVWSAYSAAFLICSWVFSPSIYSMPSSIDGEVDLSRGRLTLHAWYSYTLQNAHCTSSLKPYFFAARIHFKYDAFFYERQYSKVLFSTT